MIDAVIEREPANVQALLLKAQWLMTERKPQEALQRAQAAVKADPRSVAAHYYSGLAHDALRQRKEAIASFNEVLTPQSARGRGPGAAVAPQPARRGARHGGHVRRGRARQRAGQPRGAGQPGARPAGPARHRARRAGTGAASEAVSRTSATVHALNGSLKLQKKDFAGARAEYERALSLAPNSIEALAGIDRRGPDPEPRAAGARADRGASGRRTEPRRAAAAGRRRSTARSAISPRPRRRCAGRSSSTRRRRAPIRCWPACCSRAASSTPRASSSTRWRSAIRATSRRRPWRR